VVNMRQSDLPKHLLCAGWMVWRQGDDLRVSETCAEDWI
jgi:hypothetical protein